MSKKGCGIGKIMFLIPQFIFNADCAKHDEYYDEADFSVLNKIYADVIFFALMLEDIRRGKYSFLLRNFYFFVATLYFLIVLIMGWIPWLYSAVWNKYMI